jgi:RNA polymerase sigma-70 factor (ECF subfamily)
MPPYDSETTAWFTKEVQPHESVLRSYLIGIARPSDVDDLVQESYMR